MNVMRESITSKLKNNKTLILWKRWVYSRLSGKTGSSRHNILTEFSCFSPLSVGNYKANAALTIQSVNSTFPSLCSFLEASGQKKLEVIKVEQFPKTDSELHSAQALKVLFDTHGSDKGEHHGYHLVYGSILDRLGSIESMLEIGLGTNNTDVVSNMGRAGKPGASLRAFREFIPGANIYGADIDRRILFNEDRIQTYFVDQTKTNTFDDLGKKIQHKLDLIIDDGLHCPDANINTVTFSMRFLKRGGWLIVEDIRLSAFPVWEVVAALLPDDMDAVFVHANGTGMFVAHRRVV